MKLISILFLLFTFFFLHGLFCGFNDLSSTSKEDARQIIYNLEQNKNLDDYHEALTSKNFYVRLHSVEMLGNIGNEDSVKYLKGIFPSAEKKIKEKILLSVSKIDAQNSIDFLLDTLKDNSWEVRALSVDLIGDIGDEKGEEGIKIALKDKNPTVLIASCQQIITNNYLSALDNVIALLSFENRNVIDAAKTTILHFKERSIPFLKKHIDNYLKNNLSAIYLFKAFSTDYFKDSATIMINLLGQIGSEKPISYLISLLDYSLYPYNNASVMALEVLFRKYPEAMRNALKIYKSDKTVIHLLSILSKLKIKDISRDIKKFFSSKNSSIRLQTILSLANIPIENNLKFLIDHYQSMSEIERFYALRGLASSSYKKAEKLFVSALSSDHKGIIYYGITGLVQLKDKSHFQKLIKLYQIDDYRLKNLILIALKNYPQYKTANFLINHLDETNPNLKSFMIALIRTKHITKAVSTLKKLYQKEDDFNVKCELAKAITELSSSSILQKINCHPIEIDLILPEMKYEYYDFFK